ncbi:hypothetical protein CLAFUR0_11838 [Fulvia fulva]|nr:hypothetical protein CLAFUR0_11838 [Fulvia fulva]
MSQSARGDPMYPAYYSQPDGNANAPYDAHVFSNLAWQSGAPLAMYEEGLYGGPPTFAGSNTYLPEHEGDSKLATEDIDASLPYPNNSAGPSTLAPSRLRTDEMSTSAGAQGSTSYGFAIGAALTSALGMWKQSKLEASRSIPPAMPPNSIQARQGSETQSLGYSQPSTRTPHLDISEFHFNSQYQAPLGSDRKYTQSPSLNLQATQAEAFQGEANRPRASRSATFRDSAETFAGSPPAQEYLPTLEAATNDVPTQKGRGGRPVAVEQQRSTTAIQYQAGSGFSDVDAARAFLENQARSMSLKRVDDFDAVRPGFNGYVQRVYAAISHASSEPYAHWPSNRQILYRNGQETARVEIDNQMSSPLQCKVVEGQVWLILDDAIEKHKTSKVPEAAFSSSLKPEVRYICSERIELVIKAISENKLCALDVVEGNWKELVLAPKAVLSRKLSNTGNNARKQGMLKEATQAKSAIGGDTDDAVNGVITDEAKAAPKASRKMASKGSSVAPRISPFQAESTSISTQHESTEASRFDGLGADEPDLKSDLFINLDNHKHIFGNTLTSRFDEHMDHAVGYLEARATKKRQQPFDEDMPAKKTRKAPARRATTAASDGNEQPSVPKRASRRRVKQPKPSNSPLTPQPIPAGPVAQSMPPPRVAQTFEPDIDFAQPALPNTPDFGSGEVDLSAFDGGAEMDYDLPDFSLQELVNLNNLFGSREDLMPPPRRTDNNTGYLTTPTLLGALPEEPTDGGHGH